MIGDSIVDIRTARAAGIPVIAVDFGYSEHPVSELGPDRTISSFVQLPMSIAAVGQSDMIYRLFAVVGACRVLI